MVDTKKVGESLLELERSLNERWSVGDSSGYFENYHEDLSYFDPIVDGLLVGREADLVQKPAYCSKRIPQSPCCGE